ncbi:hypothetical protein [Streptomyces sp. NPDC048473]|uniref:hypothetical protein n=1 Tax=unclassified Streptomyces TaxID=2593676 RepID=UPI003720469E
MTEHIDASASLADAARVERGARAGSGRYTRYLWVFAAWQLILIPAVVLGHGNPASNPAIVANGLLVVGLSVFAQRQPAQRRGLTRKHVLLIDSWTVLYSVTVVLAVTAFKDSVVLAVLAALTCAIPLAVGAWPEMRRSV